MVALLIKSRTGPSQPDLGGKKRGGEEKRKERRKEGKRKEKEGKKEKEKSQLPLSIKCVGSVETLMHFLQDCVTFSTPVCSLSDGTCVLLFMRPTLLWLRGDTVGYVASECE